MGHKEEKRPAGCVFTGRGDDSLRGEHWSHGRLSRGDQLMMVAALDMCHISPTLQVLVCQRIKHMSLPPHVVRLSKCFIGLTDSAVCSVCSILQS